MKKVSDIMGKYFNPDLLKGKPGLLRESVPLSPHCETWQVVGSPERLSRRFKFLNRARMIDFVNEVMVYEDQVAHHAMIRSDHLSVDIEVYTHDLNRITNVDREFAKSVDAIYEDVRNYIYQQEKAPNFF